MKDILYYPYINIPRTEWTYRALFYYDTIASIVPQQFFRQPDESYDAFMLQLIKEGLVIPIDPVRTLDRPWEVGEPFLDLIKNDHQYLQRRRRAFRLRIRSMPLEILAGSRMHAQKFAYGIYYALKEMGLARRHDDDWYDVDPITARLLMEYLATVLSHKLERRATTDIIPSSKVHQANLNQRRRIVLEQLIPFPNEVDFGKLLDFKLAYPDLLAAFRVEVEDIVLDLNLEENSPLFNNRVQRLLLRKEELLARMNEKKIKDVILGSVCGVVGAGLSLVTASSFLGGLVAVPSLANAVYTALNVETPEKILDQSGMKYLALLDKRLGSSYR